MTKREKLAYLGGLIDGEGYIGIKRTKPYKPNGEVSNKYHARIQIRMVEEAGIKLLKETLGGNYYKEKAHAENGRPLYCYQASDQRAENILIIILPFLRIKKEPAKTVLKLRKLQSQGSKHRTKITGYRVMPHSRTRQPVKIPNLAFSNQYVAQCDSLWQQCRDLNRVGYVWHRQSIPLDDLIQGHWLASKNARAKPGGVIERRSALSGDGAICHMRFFFSGSTRFIFGSIKLPQRQVFFVQGSP